jgi:hypothetical protein
MQKLVKPTLEEEVKIYRRLLINLHTANWTFHTEKVKELLQRIGEYSYTRTNSVEGETGEEREQNEIRTLLNLDK